MNYKERSLRQAFLDEIRAVERKHGYRLTWFQPRIETVVQPIVPPVSKAARKAVDEIVNGPRPSFWQRLFKNHEPRKTDQVQT